MCAVCQVFITVEQQQPFPLTELWPLHPPIRRNMSQYDTCVLACTLDIAFWGGGWVIWDPSSTFLGFLWLVFWAKWLGRKKQCEIWPLERDPCWSNYEQSQLSTIDITLTLIKFTLLQAKLREGVEVIFGAADGIEPHWTAISFW